MKTITISKKVPKALVISFLVALSIVFVREHWGKFKYDVKVNNSSSIYNSNGKIDLSGTRVTGETPLQFIRLDTPFNSTIFIEDEQYYMKDKWNGKFNKYSFKVKYYIQALIKDFKYVIYYWIGISVLGILLLSFRIKFK
jgi:hypothetical protein